MLLRRALISPSFAIPLRVVAQAVVFAIIAWTPVTVAEPPAAAKGRAPRAYTGAQELELAVAEADPGEIPEAVAGAIQRDALTLMQGGEPLLDLWLVTSLPASTGRSATAVVNYASIPMGTFLGVVRINTAHVDYRGQLVPPGTYGLRYLQQPVDGEHAGISFFRDFAALVPLTSTTTVEAIDFEQALAAGLMLNTHPYVLGLWPPRELAVAEPPGLAPIDDMWGILTIVPREGAGPVPVGIIVVGGEPPEGYSWRPDGIMRRAAARTPIGRATTPSPRTTDPPRGRPARGDRTRPCSASSDR